MKRGRIIQSLEAAINGFHDGCPKLPESTLRGLVTCLNGLSWANDRERAMFEVLSCVSIEQIQQIATFIETTNYRKGLN